MDRDGLERIYREAAFGPMPAGSWRGRALVQLDDKAWVRALDWLLFRWPTFGIDWDDARWWFVRPDLRAGHFTFRRGPSRWRDTDALLLEYEVSRLPGRGHLYDEVKPLAADLCLGIGGINAPRGRGEHFFFALSRPV